MRDFVLINRMWQTWITSQRNIAPQRGKYRGRLTDPFPRDMRIRVAAAEEAGSSRKVPRVSEFGSGRANQTTRKCYETAITGGIPCDEFGRETCTLGKAQKRYLTRQRHADIGFAGAFRRSELVAREDHSGNFVR